MKERPIPFNGEMVRAILAGKKTQTRRLCKAPIFTGDVPPTEDYILIGHDTHCVPQWIHADNFVSHEGDRLWVRETWHPVIKGHPVALYRADDTIYYHDTGWGCDRGIYKKPKKWHPSIHMPRWASRLTLEITAVRVERLQDISGPDCWAEGIDMDCEKYGSVVECYADLWRSIYGAASWERNPWVWVYEFKIAERKDGK